MFVRKKVAALSFAVLVTLTWTGVGIGVASSAQAVTWTCGDTRSATWGSGQVCKGSNGNWRIRDRDDATDGYCVEGYFYSEDSSSWKRTSPRSQECNGVWKTTEIGTVPYRDGVRLVRGDGRYLTLDLP
jgi:hypothetical protein